MKTRLFLLFLGLVLASSASQAHTNLTAAYSTIGFDPTAPGNKVMVLFSDAHMELDPNELWNTTGLDARLVTNVNAMVPPPAKIVVSGDVSSSYATCPGQMPGCCWQHNLATNEMVHWLSAIQAFTNIAQTNILWVPGNHDQDPRETDAELFCSIFTNMPPYQWFDLGGVRFFLLNGGNIGFPSESGKEWLKRQVALTSPTQTVAVVIHQPPFGCGSGNPVLLRECFEDWQTRWWDFSGHAHYFGQMVYDIGRSNVTMCCIGTVNSNAFNGQTSSAGFMVLCLSNGVAGRIYYHFLDGNFEVVPEPDWKHPVHYEANFEGIDGLLWRREKTPGPVVEFPWKMPEMVSVDCYYDAGYYYAYTKELQWALPLAEHGNQATHFLLPGNIDPFSIVSFSTDRTNWVEVPMPPPAHNFYAFPIPREVSAAPTGYARFYAPAGGDNGIGTWGLSTTNLPPYITFPQFPAVPDQAALAGRLFTLTNVAIDPYSPPDTLSYTLLSGPPGATLDSRAGIFYWQPEIADSPETVNVTVKVADNGSMPMCATQQFSIVVARPSQPIVSPPKWKEGRHVFTVSGNSGLMYKVWASTNLLEWELLWTTNPASLPFEVGDPLAGASSCRFYRASVHAPPGQTHGAAP
jgi:hypothetical protein